jgi:hypothetical protein
MLSSNGWRWPTQHYQPGASALFAVSEKWFISDDYWTFNPRFGFGNSYLGSATVTANPAGGQENANGNAVTIEAISLVVGVGGAPVQLTLNGSTAPYTLADDANIWSDAPTGVAIPPRTLCCIRVARSVADSSAFVSAQYPGIRQMFGDKVEVSTSSLASKVMAGGISTALPTGNNVYFLTACAMVAQGWDGRPVVLGFGTSIEAGVGQVRSICGPSGAIGPIEHGMMSTVGGAPRLPFSNWSIAGGTSAGITGAGNNQGLTRRKGLIDLLPNVPMTCTYDGHGTNDASSVLLTWQGILQATASAIAVAFPTCRHVRSSLVVRTDSTDGFTTQTNQTAQSANWTWPSGSAWGLHHWMTGGGNPFAGAIHGVINVLDAFDGFSAGGVRGKWRVDVTDTGWTSTLQAAVTAGAAGFTVGSFPRAGGIFSILEGTNDAVQISTVTGTASPFTGNGTVQNAHASGATVVEKAPTYDGTHPGAVIAKYVGDTRYAQEKLAGTFG